MYSLQDEYNAIAYGGPDSPPFWIQPEPSDCGCRGRGWYISNLDTIHQCPIHYTEQRHPEYEEES